MADEIEELLRAAEAAEAEACAMLPTAAEERAIIDAAEELAGGEAGVPAKTQVARGRVAPRPRCEEYKCIYFVHIQ